MNLSFSPPKAWNTVPTSRMPYGLKSWLAYPLCDCRYNVNVWVYLRKNSIWLDGSRIRNSLRSERFRVVSEKRTRNERQRPREKWRQGGGGGENFSFLSLPHPLFHFLALVSFLAQPKPKIPLLGLSLLRKLPKRMLRSLNPQRKISRIQKYPDTYGQCPRIVLTDNIQSGGNCSVYYYYWQGITEARCQIIILPIPGVIIRVWRSHTLFVEKHPMLY